MSVRGDDTDVEDEDRIQAAEVELYATVNKQRVSSPEHSATTEEVGADIIPQIHLLAGAGHYAEMIEMLEKDSSMANLTDDIGCTPLMYSIQYGQLGCSQYLLGKGANPLAKTVDGATSLHFAAHTCSHKEVQLLLSTGIGLKAVDRDGRSPLHWAMKNSNAVVVDLLLSVADEEDINAKDNSRMTPIMWAAHYGQIGHIMKLRQRGALLECIDMDGMTALLWAAKAKSLQGVQALITYRNSFARESNGKSVIHFAAEYGNVKMIKTVLDLRPQAVHDIDNFGRTALHWAAVCKHEKTVKTLLKSGSATHREDVKNNTALDYARLSSFEEGAVTISKYMKKQSRETARLGPAITSTSYFSFNPQKDQDAALQSLSSEAIDILRMLATGTAMSKYANDGKGQLQSRFFWLDCLSGELCWGKSPEAIVKQTTHISSERIVKIVGGASETVESRSDYEKNGKHFYNFQIICEHRTLSLVAPSELVYKLWVEGITSLKEFQSDVLESTDASAPLNIQHLQGFASL
jgi:ankyrin repeat protein